METESAFKIISSGAVDLYPAYIAEGDDKYLISKVVKIIESTVLDEDFADFNLTKFECSASSKADSIINALLELPMLTDRRLSEFYDTFKLKISGIKSGSDSQKDPLKETEKILKEVLDEEANIICIANCQVPKNARDFFKNTVKSRALTINCSVYPDQIIPWAKAQAAERGCSLSTKAAAEFRDRIGTDMLTLVSQLDKLCAYTGKNSEITLEDVKTAVSRSLEVKIWEFTSALAEKDAKTAMRACESLLEDDPASNALSLLSYTNRYLRSMAQIQELVKKFGSKNVKLIGQNLNPNGHFSDYKVSKDMQSAKLWSEKSLRQAFEDLCQADLYLKTGSDPKLTIEKLIVRTVHRR